MTERRAIQGEIEFQLDGRRYRLSRDEVINKVTFAAPKPTDKYFITINDRPYPPKQVLMLALGLPSANFTTSAAIAILGRLGFEINSGSAPQLRTESERLFETYLTMSGFLEYQFEPQIPDSSARPDFLVQALLDGTKREILFEVKEFQATADDFRLGGGSYDPYGPIREKIEEGRKKFRESKQYPCALVLYNAGKPLVDLRWEFIYGSMLGNLGYSFPFDSNAGKLVEKPVLTPTFAQGGKMHREKDGVPIEPQNTTISAIVVLELLPVGKRRFEIELKRHEQSLARSLRYEEFFEFERSARGTERDISLRQLRTVTCLNPYSRIPFPGRLFVGPYDECYGVIDGALQRIYAGSQLKLLEDSQRVAGLEERGLLAKGSSS